MEKSVKIRSKTNALSSTLCKEMENLVVKPAIKPDAVTETQTEGQMNVDASPVNNFRSDWAKESRQSCPSISGG